MILLQLRCSALRSSMRLWLSAALLTSGSARVVLASV
jgi:hypothetical protein